MGIAGTLICAWERGASQPSEEQMQDLIKVFKDVPPLEIVC
jgi:hypothetical protein